ncbi:MAG: hypothetical protein ACOCXP_01355 [Candidatus Dojkabacteria bacterium]
MSKINPKSKIFRVSVVFFLLLLGAIFAVLAFMLIQFIREEINQSDEAAAGVFSSANLEAELENYQTESVSQFNVRYDPQYQDEWEVLQFILETTRLEDQFSDEQLSEIKIFLIPTITNEQLLSDKYYFYETSGSLVSGSNIYFTSGFAEQIALGEPAYDVVFSSLFYAAQYTQLESDSIANFAQNEQIYHLRSVPLVSEFDSLTFSAEEEDDDENDDETRSWEQPYPQKISEYSELSPACINIDSAASLLSCEFTLYQAGQNTILPPDSQKFIEGKFDISPNARQNALELWDYSDVSEAIAEIEGLSISQSPVEFDSWDLPVLTAANYDILAGGPFYYQVDETELSQIRSKIEELGWLYEEPREEGADSASDDQFGATTRRFSYTKETALHKQQLSIMMLNTNELNADCIVSKIGQSFCDTENSLQKGNDYHIQIVLGKYNIFELLE